MSAPPDPTSELKESHPSASQASNSSDSHLTLKATDTGAGVLNTPLAAVTITETSGQTYGIAEKDTKRYKRLREESSRWLVGTMPVPLFLHTFLGGDRVDMTNMPSATGMFNDYMEEAKKGKRWPRTEKGIQTAIIRAMGRIFHLENGTKTPRCPGFSFYDTSGYADTLNPGGKFGSVKPDICLYANDHLPKIKDGIMRPEDKYSDMGFSALHFEVKSSLADDFFKDMDPKKFKGTRAEFRWIVARGMRDVSVTQLNNADHNLGQTVAYATEACKRQHRRHYFSVSVSAASIRFIRWDRAGAIVSEAFSAVEDPELFCQFFWRFAHITDVERGYDLTVEPATEDQEEVFRRAIKEHIIAQLEGDPQASNSKAIKAALEEHYQRNAVTVIHLPHSPLFDNPDLEGHHLLVSRPVAVPLSVAGRSTRTYWAVDSRTGRVVLLKDTWRYDTIRIDSSTGALRVEREGDILESMKGLVANIPGVIHQEDVPDFTIDDNSMIQYDRDLAQMTQTQAYVDADWACGAKYRLHMIVKRIHYRLVLDIAGYTLLRLRGTSELLHGARDAFQALQDAVAKWGRFHGDIAPRHIILYKEPGRLSRKGYLVDWDLSRAVDSEEKYLQEFQVSATWQFLSLAACYHNYADEPFRRHTIQDDIESMLYVVLYCGVLYLPHNTVANRFRELLSQMFDFYALSQGVPHGGFGKRKNKAERLYTSAIGWRSPLFKTWMDAIMGFYEAGTGWNLVTIGDWWDTFFVQHGGALPQADRRNNILSDGSTDVHPDWEAPQHVRDNPQESTQTSPTGPLPPELNPSARKRKVDAADLSEPEEGAPPRKYRVWVPDLEAVTASLQAWRDPYQEAMSALSTSPQTREGSYDPGAGTDGESTIPSWYQRAITPSLSELLRELAAKQSVGEETEGGGGSDASCDGKEG